MDIRRYSTPQSRASMQVDSRGSLIAHIVIKAVQAREEIKKKRRIPMMPEDVKADVEESQKCCE
jgi:hypothetical protein